jgi:hypothetical protein
VFPQPGITSFAFGLAWRQQADSFTTTHDTNFNLWYLTFRFSGSELVPLRNSRKRVEIVDGDRSALNGENSFNLPFPKEMTDGSY